ncbi:hypothetical protein D9M71_811240 [compost metagenome]
MALEPGAISQDLTARLSRVVAGLRVTRVLNMYLYAARLHFDGLLPADAFNCNMSSPL